MDQQHGDKVGLAFTKQELEDIQHDGPLMPMHLGAFKIKESFMDMSSSDEELVGASPSPRRKSTQQTDYPVGQQIS